MSCFVADLPMLPVFKVATYNTFQEIPELHTAQTLNGDKREEG